MNERMDGSGRGEDSLKFYEAKHLEPKDWKGDEAGYKDFLGEDKTYAAALSESGEEMVLKPIRTNEPLTLKTKRLKSRSSSS